MLHCDSYQNLALQEQQTAVSLRSSTVGHAVDTEYHLAVVGKHFAGERLVVGAAGSVAAVVEDNVAVDSRLVDSLAVAGCTLRRN
jgi:hypothetical protein